METFSALLALCAGNSPVPVNSPYKGQWCGALMFSLICARINDWVNKREAGDLRRHSGHYDVSVIYFRERHIPSTPPTAVGLQYRLIWDRDKSKVLTPKLLGIIFQNVFFISPKNLILLSKTGPMKWMSNQHWLTAVSERPGILASGHK